MPNSSTTFSPRVKVRTVEGESDFEGCRKKLFSAACFWYRVSSSAINCIAVSSRGRNFRDAKIELALVSTPKHWRKEELKLTDSKIFAILILPEWEDIAYWMTWIWSLKWISKFLKDPIFIAIREINNYLSMYVHTYLYWDFIETLDYDSTSLNSGRLVKILLFIKQLGSIHPTFSNDNVIDKPLLLQDNYMLYVCIGLQCG